MSTMNALVYHGPHNIKLEQVPLPTIQAPTDAIVKMLKSTICGTDLHISHGHIDYIKPGLILGHEGVGEIVEVGSGVSDFKVGDRVLISCVTSCGKCSNCKKQIYAHCENGGGWILGHLINGTQAEYVRIPFADGSLHHSPKEVSDEALVNTSDLLPTGLEIGAIKGRVRPGDTVAVVGCGPIGLSAIIASTFTSPAKIISVDLDDNRLEFSKSIGATDTVNSKDKAAAVAKIMELTGGKGVDTAIECVGFPDSFDICQKIVAVDGHIANVGVHGTGVNLELDKLWIRNITLTTGLVSSSTIPMLLKSLKTNKIPVDKLITHRFKFNEMEKAYEVFGNAAKEKAIKIFIDFE